MNKNKLSIFVAGTALAALTATACSTAPTANTAGVNSNTAVVVNSNQAPIINSNSVSNTVSHATNANMTKEEFNKTREEYTRQAKSAGSTIGSGIEDAWIHSKVKGALALENDLRDSTVNVDVDNNVVTLRGTVANANQKARAASVANSIDGVKSVKNNLTVGGGGSTTGNSNTAKNGNAHE